MGANHSSDVTIHRWHSVLFPVLLAAIAGGCTQPVSAEKADIAQTPATAEERTTAAHEAASKVVPGFLKERVAVLADDQFAGRNNLTEGNKAARAWIIADAQKIGLKAGFDAGFAQPFDVGVNICGTVPGADPALASEHVVVGAHYDGLGEVGAAGTQCKPSKGADGKDNKDTVCNGAIDNAAGVAVALFIAKTLQEATHRPRRSVTFCFFDAEEDGLLGSYFMTKNAPVVPLSSTIAMLSVDNVGSRIFSQHTSSFATDAEYSNALKAHVLAANQATGFVTWPVSSFFVGSEGGGRSDHLPFREKGVPVLFLGSGSSSVYHTVLDNISAVDLVKLRKTAEHAVVLVARIANADDRPDFQPKPQPHIDDARAMVAIADKVIAEPSSLGLTEPQLNLVKQWRGELQVWLDKPPTTDAEWTEYQTLVKAIIAAVYAFAG